MRLACLKLEVGRQGFSSKLLHFKLSKLMFRLVHKKPFGKTWISCVSLLCWQHWECVSFFVKQLFVGTACSQ